MGWQVVHLRVVDSANARPLPVRLRIAAPDGKFLPPLGWPREIPTEWGEDVGGRLCLENRAYAYVDGGCEARLPDGPLDVEISAGPEYETLRERVVRGPGQIVLRFRLTRRFDSTTERWFAGDTRAHFLSPHAAWLEGAAEGLHVVNVLVGSPNPYVSAFSPGAEQTSSSTRGPSNLLEFSGQLPALERDGRLVAVGTYNNGGRAGSLALLHSHRVVFPLRLGEPGFEHYTLHDWCAQCHRKRGLVVWPSYGSTFDGDRMNRPREGDIDALEWSADTPFRPTLLSEWYSLLIHGIRVPFIGGSGKGSNATPLGAVRTLAQLGPEEPFTFTNWIEAVRAGRTVATRGPWLRFTVDGKGPGWAILPEGTPRRVPLLAEVDSTTPIERLEIVCNGEVVAEVEANNGTQARVEAQHALPASGGHPGQVWLAARCWGADGLLAHTAAVYCGPGPTGR